MRTSLRDPNSKEKVTLICPDKGMAETIGYWLDCKDIEQVPGVVKERMKALTGSQRNARWRAKQELVTRTRKNDDEIQYNTEKRHNFSAEPTFLRKCYLQPSLFPLCDLS
jgi:hypothetical protein